MSEIKNIQLGGISNEPTDYNSKDGDLSFSYNAVLHNGSVMPVCKGDVVFTFPSDKELLLVHEYGDNKAYIFTDSDTHKKLWYLWDYDATPDDEKAKASKKRKAATTVVNGEMLRPIQVYNVDGGTVEITHNDADSNGDFMSFGFKGKAMEHITLVAKPSNNYEFVGWTVSGVTLTEEELTSAEITFQMPGNAVCFVPAYKYTSSSYNSLSDIQNGYYPIYDFTSDDEEIKQVANVRGVLVISTTKGIRFVKSSGGEGYTYLGQFPKMTFATPYIETNVVDFSNIGTFASRKVEYAISENVGLYDAWNALDSLINGTSDSSTETTNNLYVPVDKEYEDDEGTYNPLVALTNKVYEIINVMVSEIHKQGGWTAPFYVKLAYRMSDGTYAAVTRPYPLCPSTTFNPLVLITNCERVDEDGSIDVANGKFANLILRVLVPRSILKVKFDSIDEVWKDIITGVDIFASEETINYTEDKGSIVCIHSNEDANSSASLIPYYFTCSGDVEDRQICDCMRKVWYYDSDTISSDSSASHFHYYQSDYWENRVSYKNALRDYIYTWMYKYRKLNDEGNWERGTYDVTTLDQRLQGWIPKVVRIENIYRIKYAWEVQFPKLINFEDSALTYDVITKIEDSYYEDSCNGKAEDNLYKIQASSFTNNQEITVDVSCLRFYKMLYDEFKSDLEQYKFYCWGWYPSVDYQKHVVIYKQDDVYGSARPLLDRDGVCRVTIYKFTQHEETITTNNASKGYIELRRTDKQNANDVFSNVSNYYKIKEIDFDEVNGGVVSTKEDLENGVIESISTRTRLTDTAVRPYDYVASDIYANNNRLNAAVETQSVEEPDCAESFFYATYESTIDGDGNITYTTDDDGNYILEDNVTKMVLEVVKDGTKYYKEVPRADSDSNLCDMYYFYHPDTDATNLYVEKTTSSITTSVDLTGRSLNDTSNTTVTYNGEVAYTIEEQAVVKIPLTKHDYLYGAYAFNNFESILDNATEDGTSAKVTYTLPSIDTIKASSTYSPEVTDEDVAAGVVQQLIIDEISEQALGAELKKDSDGNYICGEECTISGGKAILPTTDEEYYVGNKILQSGANNPFVMLNAGTNVLGCKSIYRLCSTTKPLSQGQFGVYPLYCFTSDGIFALQTDSDGTYTSMSAVSQDVLSIDEDKFPNGHIEQLDQSILFVTKRGLMELSGQKIECITKALEGHNFLDDLPKLSTLLDMVDCDGTLGAHIEDYLQSSIIKYDYKRQLVYVYNEGSSPGLVYSILDGAWGQMENTMYYNVNSYTDSLVVASNPNYDGDTDTNEMALVDTSLKTDDETEVIKSLLITRPLMFEVGDVHKTIEDLLAKGVFDRGENAVQLVVYASNDIKHWKVVGSSVTEHWRNYSGTPYKFFRVAIVCKWKEQDSLSALTADVTPRLNNRIR